LPPGERERLLVQALCDWADFERDRGDLLIGRPLLNEAVDLACAVLGDSDPDTASAWNSLGLWCRYHGDLEAAEAAYSAALTVFTRLGNDEEEATVLHNLASLEHLAGNPSSAEATIRRAMSLRQPGGDEGPGDLGVLAAVLTDLGRYGEAADAYDRIRASLAPIATTTETAYLDANRAVLAHRRGDHAEAGVLYQAALDASERAFGPEHPQTGVVLANSAALAADLGQDRVAADLASRAASVLASSVSEEHPSLRLARTLLTSLG
jgi:tetratricopeptide (TPR) repeat protein